MYLPTSRVSSSLSSHFRVLLILPVPCRAVLLKMKIFSWMQSKLNGNQGSKKPNSISAKRHMLQEPPKEEFSDWPHGLLAIGTFGNNSLKEDPKRCNILQGCQSSSQDHPLQDISPEEVGQLEKELALILLRKQVSAESSNSSTEESETTHNLQLDNFNFPTCLDDDRSNNIDTFSGGDSTEKRSDWLQHSSSSTSVILNRGKDIHADHNKNAIGKKSLCYLLKKMFLCRNGFVPIPSLRDPIPDKSKMEKILRAILHKKIYPQNSSSNPKTTAKKYLETSPHMHNSDDSEDEMLDTANDGSKWVKTDSEFIVLEI